MFFTDCGKRVRTNRVAAPRMDKYIDKQIGELTIHVCLGDASQPDEPIQHRLPCTHAGARLRYSQPVSQSPRMDK